MPSIVAVYALENLFVATYLIIKVERKVFYVREQLSPGFFKRMTGSESTTDCHVWLSFNVPVCKNSNEEKKAYYLVFVFKTPIVSSTSYC